ncbi:MAG: hypothetical protein A2020_14760 [Lentisphaerae bacterium GWF2_45_14]|nr:MAG: hypothetical protein A2020_14760 [Lentisphaerae bacterium GWF2_45_14]
MSIIDNAREIADLVKKLDNVELYRRIAKLEEEIIDLSRAKREADCEVQKLREQIEKRQKLEFRAPYYFAPGDTQPYCPKCWEAENISVHLQGPTLFNGRPQYQCPNCKNWHREGE